MCVYFLLVYLAVQFSSRMDDLEELLSDMAMKHCVLCDTNHHTIMSVKTSYSAVLLVHGRA
jgi:hypothetical protein